MRYRYLIYELVIETTFPCTLLPDAPHGVPVDITVVEGIVPRELDNPVVHNKIWDASPGRYLFRGGALSGRFLVEDGKRITLQRNPRAEDDRLAVHFFVSVLTALLQQRELLVLHANTALTERGAVAVCGESGAGKTTAVAGLLARGNRLVADDITVLRVTDDGIVEVLPGAPHLHLCEDTAEQFGFDITGVPRFSWRRMKAALPVPEIMADAPALLRAIYLVKIITGSCLSVRPLAGGEKFNALQECIYGPLLADAHKSMFHVFSVVMEQVAVYLIERPTDRWTVDEVIEEMLNG